MSKTIHLDYCGIAASGATVREAKQEAARKLTSLVSDLTRHSPEIVTCGAYSSLVYGWNDELAQREYLASHSDFAAAAECIEAWGLDQAGDEPRFEGDEQEPSHMAKHGYEAIDLAAAFASIRNA